ncbi:MAG: TIGR00180 family glycosyltransferase [Xanthobacteraceae bacterium]|jgi:glycosyltransferase domain-containing protein
MQPRLTVILPLKGRHLFTLRFLWHANRLQVPYRLLIADGQVHPVVAELLESSRNLFPNLDIEYIRYRDDADFSRFFAKMSGALGHVRTPYAMLADNDDFLGIAGIDNAVSFLDAHSDYVCARGRRVNFSIYAGLNNKDGGLRGRLDHLRLQRDGEDIHSPIAAERLRRGGLQFSVYYAVYRSADLATIWQEVAEIDFSDLQLHEIFCTMRAMTFGKSRVDGSVVSYFRQDGTSLNSSWKTDSWVHHLVRSRFTSDVEAMVGRITASAEAADREEEERIAEAVRSQIETNFSEMLSTMYGSLQQMKRAARRKIPKLSAWVKKRPHYFVRRDRTSVLRKLARDGASSKSLEHFCDGLAQIEEVCSGDQFAGFIRPFLSMARSGSSRDWF